MTGGTAAVHTTGTEPVGGNHRFFCKLIIDVLSKQLICIDRQVMIHYLEMAMNLNLEKASYALFAGCCFAGCWFLLAGLPMSEEDLDQRPLKRLRPSQMYSDSYHPVRHGDAHEFFLNCRSQKSRP